MSDEPTKLAPWRSYLKPTLLLTWVAMYVLCMAASEWRFSAPHWFQFGSPSLAALNRMGAAVPFLVKTGDWQRILLDGLMSTSLIGLAFTLWIWASLGGLLGTITGTARTWIVFVAGGAGGALAHYWSHPGGRIAGSGSSGCILAALGALAVWGFANRGNLARHVRRLVVGFLLVCAVLSLAFTYLLGGGVSQGSFGYAGLLGGFVAGMLCMLAFGPGRAVGPPGVGVRAVALLALAGTIAAASVQLPSAFRGAASARVQSYVLQLQAAEREAWNLYRLGIDATPERRAGLGQDLDAIQRVEWLRDWEGREALFAYLDAMGPIATGTIPDPHGLRRRLQSSFATYVEHENRLRVAHGLASRAVNYWE